MFLYRFSPSSKYFNFVEECKIGKNQLKSRKTTTFFIFRLQEAKSSFFQRQFSSALKLFRNLLSWEGILSDTALKDIAISSLLNRYLLLAIRVNNIFSIYLRNVNKTDYNLISLFCTQICSPVDAATKSHIIMDTLPRVWLQQPAIIDSLKLLFEFLKALNGQLDRKNPLHM